MRQFFFFFSFRLHLQTQTLPCKRACMVCVLCGWLRCPSQRTDQPGLAHNGRQEAGAHRELRALFTYRTVLDFPGGQRNPYLLHTFVRTVECIPNRALVHCRADCDVSGVARIELVDIGQGQGVKASMAASDSAAAPTPKTSSTPCSIRSTNSHSRNPRARWRTVAFSTSLGFFPGQVGRLVPHQRTCSDNLYRSWRRGWAKELPRPTRGGSCRRARSSIGTC
jgi:hypothetical protein